MSLNPDMIDRWHKSDLLLLGGSAGAFKVLFNVVKMFSPGINKAIVIVIHRKKNNLSEIEELFAGNSRLNVVAITDKEIICKDTIYVAPANYHTLIENQEMFSLDVSEPVWYSKPSIDVTFESAAEVFKNRCTAVLLSGANQDGAAGLLKLRNLGALTIVQHPDDAEMAEMPLSAIQIDAADYILTSQQIFELLQT